MLKDKPQKILAFIAKFQLEHSYPPTIRDIQAACSISSTSVVNYNLNILQTEGYLTRSGNVSRGIEITKSEDTQGIPIHGSIAAGEPIEVPSQESWSSVDAIDSLNLPPEFFSKKKGIYALRVKGISMIDALVDDGDVVIIEPTDYITNGDMIVAWLKLESSVTLKRFYKENNYVRLQPANPLMEPIYVSAENLDVQGKVIGIIRHMN
jgi:repressor LexA